jgi:hypothetical protein
MDVREGLSGERVLTWRANRRQGTSDAISMPGVCEGEL